MSEAIRRAIRSSYISFLTRFPGFEVEIDPDGSTAHATFGQQQLDIPQAQTEHVIGPDGVTDDLGGEAMAVMRVWCRSHPASFTRLQSTHQFMLP